MSDPLLFILAVLMLLGTPGPTNTLLATSGAVAGVRRSLLLLAGELSGYLVAIAAIRIVLGPVFAAYLLIGSALKVAVAVYLGWIAIKLWLRGARLSGPASAVSLRNVFLTTLLNPKALIFALTIIPVAHPALPWFIAAFAVSVVCVGFCWILIGRAIGATAGERHAGLVPRIASVALAGFAGLIFASAFG
jgi:threonine/homoserine/homoserine lactone efflux protein